MVFLAISSQGLLDALEIAKESACAVWCGADAISEEQLKNLKDRNVTRFIYPLQNADEKVLNAALSTIEQHHPRERIWIEGLTSSATAVFLPPKTN